MDSSVSIVAVVDPDEAGSRFFGVEVVTSYAEIDSLDAVVITHLTKAKDTFDRAFDLFGPERVLAPDLLGLRPPPAHGAA